MFLLNGKKPNHRSGENGTALDRNRISSAFSRNGASRPLRVLILSASVGAGHKRAAEAIERAARQLHPEAQIRNVDVLTLSTRLFRRCYGRMYLDFVNNAPLVLAFFYRLMDKYHPQSDPGALDKFRLFLEKLNLRGFLAFLREEPWDLVINTHFLPGEIIASLRRKKELYLPQVMVTTDFETHHLWITEPCERYFTATEEGALYLQKQGVAPERTSVVGIPIHPNFCRTADRGAYLARHGLVGNRPIVLQLAGGYGVGAIEELYGSLLEVEEPLQLVVVTGHNEAARRRLETLQPPARHRVKILGYTQQMDELMVAADLVVSKPGGLTTSETLACGTPLVIVDPVMGQEERNSDFLLENGAAIKVSHPATLAFKLTGLLREPERLERMRAAARRLAHPRAAFEIVEQSLATRAAHVSKRVPQG